MFENKNEELGFDVVDENGNNLLENIEDVALGDQEDNKDDEGSSEKQKEEKSQKQTEDDSVDEEKVKHKSSRAQDRIRELVRQKKDSESKFMAEIMELRQRLNETSKDSLQSQKSFIDARIADVKKSLTRAQEEGKYEEAAEHMVSLSDLQTKKTVVDSHVQVHEKEQEKTKENRQTKNDGDDFDDTALLSWIGKNADWWQKDSVKTTLAVRLSKRLDKEGILTPDDEAYYEELDERLSELLGEKNMDNNNKDNKDLQSSGKQEAATKKKPQTTTGASRTPAVQSGKKMVINLSPQERAMARRMNMSELEWAKQKYRKQKNTDENGYQVIFDN